jgi:hypothetical protein
MADGFVGSASIRIDAGSGYHSHPHSQYTEWFRWGLISNFLHAAHNLIHIFILRSVSASVCSAYQYSCKFEGRTFRICAVGEQRAAGNLGLFAYLAFHTPDSSAEVPA